MTHRYLGLMRVGRRTLAVLLLGMALGPLPSHADPYLLMARSEQGFPEAMLALQNAIASHGYTLSRVQRVDIGLTASGFETDKYRIVFFGKPAEVRDLSARYPHLIPYLPMKMTIFAENGQTLLVTEDMTRLQALATTPELTALFQRWKDDILSMIRELRFEER